jgi:hypothetical protein
MELFYAKKKIQYNFIVPGLHDRFNLRKSCLNK